MRTATRLLAEPSDQARRADGFVLLTDPRRAGAAGELGRAAGEYRSLMRRWFRAALGVPTMILSHPWVFSVLEGRLPRGSDRLRLVWR